MSEEQPCSCFTPPFLHINFVSTSLGVDPENGRYADVELLECKQCGRIWLNYFFEIEAFSRSGRWFRGLLTPELIAQATPESAVAILESLPWYFRGGSYFDGEIRRIDGPGAIHGF